MSTTDEAGLTDQASPPEEASPPKELTAEEKKAAKAKAKKDAERRAKRIETARKAYDPRKVPGTPTIGFAAKPVTSPPWNVAMGEFELELVIRSAGGVGRGVSVRVSGAALGALELESVSTNANGTTGSFEADGDGFRAEIEDLDLCQGYVFPMDPRPNGDVQKAYALELIQATHLTLKVRGRATKAGSHLMRIEIAALNAKSSPLRWMRPLNVE